jgi:hypothetical protein
MLFTKGSTPFIVASFWIKKLELNSGIVLTIILPFEERETIEITSPLIPLVRKALLSKLRTEIAENKLACSIWASRKVLFLERAIDFILVLRVLELLGGFLVSRVLLLLVSVLGPFPPWFLDLVCDTIVQFFSEYGSSWVAILAQVGFPEVVLARIAWVAGLAWVLAWISIRLVAFSRFTTWEASKVLV